MDGNQTDVQDVKTSASNDGTSTEPQSYSQKDVEALVEKAVNKTKSDVLAEFGRYRKANDETFKQLRAELDERELSVAPDDETKSDLKQRQEIRRQRAELAREKEDVEKDKSLHAEMQTRVQRQERDSMVTRIAGKHGIDLQTLSGLLEDGMDEARIEKIASVLPKKQTNTPKADSGVTSGGAQGTVAQIRMDYISGKTDAVQYEQKMRALGLKP